VPPRPNFTGMKRNGDNLILSGTSEASEEVLDIHVVLTQKDRVPAPASIRVTRIGTFWDAVIPAEKFVPGPAVAFGVETRAVNATTTTWVEQVTIP
jgi:hypothetical protein